MIIIVNCVYFLIPDIDIYLNNCKRMGELRILTYFAQL